MEAFADLVKGRGTGYNWETILAAAMSLLLLQLPGDSYPPPPHILPGSPHHVSGQRALASGFQLGPGSATLTTSFSCFASPKCEKGFLLLLISGLPHGTSLSALIRYIINPLYLTPSIINTKSGLVFLSKSWITQQDRISTSTLLIKGRLEGTRWKAKCLRLLRGGAGTSRYGEKLLGKASWQSWSLNRTWKDREHTDSRTAGRRREKPNSMLRDKIRKVCKQKNKIILWGESQD